MTTLQITQLNIYPIKSTAGLSLAKTRVERYGFQYDRRYMLVDPAGKFLTGRQYPLLTQVQTQLQENGIYITAATQAPLFLPFASTQLVPTIASIWRDQCPVYVMGEQYNRWFSTFLGTECRLVQLQNQQGRPVDPNYSQPGDIVSFADGFPILLLSESSLQDLNQRLDSPVEMERFRPNIVVSGCDPFAEDQWQEIAIGTLRLKCVKPCSRCIFTTVDPKTGEKHPQREPLNTLAEYRKRKGGLFFGQNIIPMLAGEIKIGDFVTVK